MAGVRGYPASTAPLIWARCEHHSHSLLTERRISELMLTLCSVSADGPSNEDSNTGLIVAVAVLACLLVAVIAAAAFRQRQLLRRSTASYTKWALSGHLLFALFPFTDCI